MTAKSGKKKDTITNHSRQQKQNKKTRLAVACEETSVQTQGPNDQEETNLWRHHFSQRLSVFHGHAHSCRTPLAQQGRQHSLAQPPHFTTYNQHTHHQTKTSCLIKRREGTQEMGMALPSRSDLDTMKTKKPRSAFFIPQCPYSGEYYGMQANSSSPQTNTGQYASTTWSLQITMQPSQGSFRQAQQQLHFVCRPAFRPWSCQTIQSNDTSDALCCWYFLLFIYVQICRSILHRFNAVRSPQINWKAADTLPPDLSLALSTLEAKDCPEQGDSTCL